jgi:hypothetical protein
LSADKSIFISINYLHQLLNLSLINLCLCILSKLLSNSLKFFGGNKTTTINISFVKNLIKYSLQLSFKCILSLFINIIRNLLFMKCLLSSWCRIWYSFITFIFLIIFFCIINFSRYTCSFLGNFFSIFRIVC